MVYDRALEPASLHVRKHQSGPSLTLGLGLGLGIITNDQGVIAISANVEVFYKVITHPV